MMMQAAQIGKNEIAHHPLFVEIGVEEIPSNVLPLALKQLPEIAEQLFKTAGLLCSKPQAYGTPRRLVLYCAELATSQETKEEIIVGPPKKAAFDAKGLPTRAAEGFAKSQKTLLSEIQLEDVATLGDAAKGKKGDYLVLRKTKVGEKTAHLLETLLPEIIGALRFPRTMRWNDTGVVFIRPIRSILALYGREVIPFSFAGVESGNETQGHHIMSPECFQVTDFKSYCSELSDRFVMINAEDRVRVITAQMTDLSLEKGGILDLSDTRLIWEAAYTVEWPKAICGDFDAPFLELPKEIIITAMGEHQGYSPLYNKDGTLLPHFITILNIDSENLSLIQAGNERVLRARLFDAKFYFDQDRMQPLSSPSRLEALKKVVFQAKLGSVYDKVLRIEGLAVFIAEALNWKNSEISELREAARLCKSDLLTGIVQEFTSLQGTMGRIYTLLEDQSKEAISVAIEEHYLPKKAGGFLPQTKLGQILSIADKMDTLVGCFLANFEPTGSEDPYAIRRQALGMIRILDSTPSLKSLSLEKLINEAIDLYKVGDIADRDGLPKAVSGFLKIRMGTHLSELGIPTSIQAVILHRFVFVDKPADLVARAQALFQFSKNSLFGPLMMAFKRIVRILPEGFDGKINEAVLVHPSEKALHGRYVDVHEAIQDFWDKQSYSELLEQLSTLNDPLNQFFEDVMVMDKDEEIRQNRLSLLFQIQQQFKPFGDFSKIVSGETPK